MPVGDPDGSRTRDPRIQCSFTSIRRAFGQGDKGSSVTEHFEDVVTTAFHLANSISNFNFADRSDPVTGVHASRREGGQDIEDGVGKASDVQNIGAIRGLSRSIGLEIDAGKLRIRVARLQLGPFAQRRGVMVAGPTSA